MYQAHIIARNVHNALEDAIDLLLSHGVREDSRNGKVLVAPTPVLTEYSQPRERVLFGGSRDANPFFHLMESLWMLAGRNDVAFPLYFNKRFAEYSDDGVTVHGAYGFRWRVGFGFDQITRIIQELQENPKSRRAVLQMWYPVVDLGMDFKDVPCNTSAYFDLRNGVLNMTVCNRSNDAIWGAYGANAVHFSVLQEYIASALKVPVGTYYQFSNNLHVYTDIYPEEKLIKIAAESSMVNFYNGLTDFTVKPYPLVSVDIDAWNADLHAFMINPTGVAVFNDPFFNEVAKPMYLSWRIRKEKLGDGSGEAAMIKATDWRAACLGWISRRERKH